MVSELAAAQTRLFPPRAMLARDRGPIRGLVRDLVDSRRHVGVLLLPATILPVAANFASLAVRAFAVSVWFTAILLTVLDMVVTGIVVSRRIKTDFPEEKSRRGHIGYAVVRTAQFRRFRLPPPRVRPGDTV